MRRRFPPAGARAGRQRRRGRTGYRVCRCPGGARPRPTRRPLPDGPKAARPSCRAARRSRAARRAWDFLKFPVW